MSDNQESSVAVIQPTSIAGFNDNRKMARQFVKDQLKEGTDYGIIPRTKTKSLWQPGAEKLASLYGLVPTYTVVKEVEDFETGFFYYKYRCDLTHFNTGRFAGSAERSCNSNEKKYLYKWVNGGRVKKDPEELIEDINTYQSMAQKRCLVAAVKTATAASEIFDESDGVGHDSVSTQGEDFTILLSRYFAAATERGFKPEQAKAVAYKSFGVDSMTKLTMEQLNDIHERLVTKFKIVGKGEKPVALSPFDEDIEEGEIVEEPKTEKKEKDKQKCYVNDCENQVSGDFGSFCSEECRSKYWENTPKKASDFSFQEKINKLKEKGRSK